MRYVLILTLLQSLSGGAGSITSVGPFHTKHACEVAGTAWIEQIWPQDRHEYHWLCIRIDDDTE